MLLAAEAHPALAEAPERPLVIAMTGKYPPFSYFDERGTLAGYDADVARAICTKLSRRCELRTLEWDALLGALLTDRIDLAVASVAITEERAKRVAFSRPYYESGARLFGLAGTRLPDDGVFTIGVTLGTTFEAVARERFPAAEVRIYKGDTDAFQDLRAGRLTVVFTDDLVGAYVARTSGIDVVRVGERLLDERMGVAIKPGREALLAQVDGALATLREDGVLDALLDRHIEGRSAKALGARAEDAAVLLLRGLASTLRLCIEGIGTGILASLLLAWLLLAPPLVSRPTAALVDFVRATPFVVQLFALYFVPPSLGLSIGAHTSAVAAIALHSSAYLAEVIKTAYRAVPDGQRHAAQALGLSRARSLRHVIAPQMLPIAMVPALNTVVAMIKDSAIVSVIGVYELTLQAQRIIAATFRPLELYAAAAVLYFLVTWPLLLLGRRLEKRWRARGLLHGD